MATAISARKIAFPRQLRVVDASGRAVWHKSAPQAVRRACSCGDLFAGWEAWAEHLVARKAPLPLARLLPGKADPFSWASSDRPNGRPSPAWLARAVRLLRDRHPTDPWLENDLIAWLAESGGARAKEARAQQSLACVHALPGLAAVLSPQAWWALLDHLLATVRDATEIRLEDAPLAQQLLCGELPLTLAYLLPEIAPCRKLKRAARRALSGGLFDLLDDEGLPHARHLALLPPLLACWTRSCALGNQLKDGCWTPTAARQYQRLVRHALRLVRHDGTLAFSNGSAKGAGGDLFTAALQFDDDKDDRRIAALVLSNGQPSRKTRTHDGLLPRPSVHCEWAATAVLRPRWSRNGERLSVLYPDRSLQMEFGCGRDVLWSGAWEVDFRCFGQPAAPTSDWQEVLWVSDDDVDYLELEIELAGEIRMQRQIVLARNDSILFMADAVLADELQRHGPGKLEYRGCLPLCAGVAFEPSADTREGYLVASKRRALVVPLALPEWRADQRTGELTQTERGLELYQSSAGRRLYAPLFFDLDRQRQRGPLTWRQLTVAQGLAAQPHDVAVGYRVAVGKRQWLIYRSLADKANRTLLGHNLSTEMLLARFDRSGEVEPLIEIE